MPEEFKAELERRQAQGLPADSATVRETAAMTRVMNSVGSDRIVRNFHNGIRVALNQRFGFNLPVTARPQLQETVNQFLRYHDSLRGIPISNHALAPRAAVILGKWGEMRLDQILNGAGTKQPKPLKTSLTYRKPDQIFNRIAHESKGGIEVRLGSKIRTQILKDAELIRRNKLDAVHWHFFQGAHPDILNFLEQNGIGYTLY